ncbi:ABC transporter permease [Armatimonas rosea]|uniref:ABC-type antimicrobial peptide transport system permease subunit n=1 Tax=Armatimonas rosea TaxID=685828 RepID=A0A7W9SMX3_ARMRO|nr:ABC transporter permease [Armatimonas rosea]MBB6049285.1 ABC-type antimicrobial peptide transport system permease subunit [Armatimonas rosea]
MNLLKLALAGLKFHKKAHLGVFLGAVLAAAILTGALAVGDSVRYSLTQQALARIGGIEHALYNPGRFFRTELTGELGVAAPTSAAILLRGAAANSEGTARAGRVQVVGVDEAFWKLGGAGTVNMAEDGVALNERLAKFLGVDVGDEVLIRVDKPSLLSRDAPLSKIEDATVALRLPVRFVITEQRFGNFSLDANQIPPYNAFIPRATLQKAIGQEGRANLLLVGSGIAPDSLTRALWEKWKLTDAGLKLKPVPATGELELRTDRVFLEPEVAKAAETAQPGARRILTYFVNRLTFGGKSTPYSTVAALEGAPLPDGMGDDEALINQWLADDTGAKVGDKITLTYWLVGPLRKLEEHTSAFKIRGIVPLSGPTLDPALMPDIPGLSDKKDCRQWEPGVPIDLEKIRDKDQAYWSAFRGTPKAFITLKAGQTIWNNRFGNLTAIRYKSDSATVEACVRQALSPAALGLFFQPIRERALSASANSMDFGSLFLGFSIFLIVAALLLAALLFGFGVEQRSREVGTLLAIGVTPRRVRTLLLLEGGLIASLASVAGVFVATLYTRAVIAGLGSVWKDAVVSSPLTYYAKPETLIGGGIGSFLVALLVIWLVARKQGQATAQALLSGNREVPLPSEGRAPGKREAVSAAGRWLPLILPFLAVGLALFGIGKHGEEAAGIFFTSGALLLIAGILAARQLLQKLERTEGVLSLTSVGRRNAARRLSRSTGAITLLACGSFLVIAVGANRHDPREAARERASGTGGFALYAEASLPVYQDLNSAEGRDAFGLDGQEMADAKVVPFRLREGDEASCLNLNRAQTPRLLGVDPKLLAERSAFGFSQSLADKKASPWSLLDWDDGTDTIPVIGDMNTVMWMLHSGVGQTIDYTDDRGTIHKLKVVGIINNSVLQGNLILSERHFTKLFANHSGYQVFLVDTPEAKTKALAESLTRGLEDNGLSVATTPERLGMFSAVENTYLSIFAILGGMGLLLGSLGLGVIVLRNVLERQGELALLRAIGFTKRSLHQLVFSEHVMLLFLGLAIGVAAALVAVLPSLKTPGVGVPFVSLGLTLLGVLGSGLLWVWLATTAALRSSLLGALRSE